MRGGTGIAYPPETLRRRFGDIAHRCQHQLRKPALDLSDVVRQPCTVITGASQ
jgi:hypothetical protein